VKQLTPKPWATARLGDVLAEPLINGRSVPTASVGFPVLRLTALANGHVDLSQQKIGAWSVADANRYLVRAGDFLVSRGNGSRTLVGRGGVVPSSPSAVAFPDTLIRVRVDDRLVDTGYLRHVWHSTAVREQIESRARTTAGIYKINQQDLEAVTLPIPPLSEQRRIVAALEERLSDLDAAVAGLERAQTNLANYRQSVLQQAVLGKLMAPDSVPATESGHELLKRVRASRRGVLSESQAPLPVGTCAPAHWTVSSLETLTDGVRVICYGILMPKEDVDDGVLYVKVRDMRGDCIDVSKLQRTSREIEARYARARLRAGDLLLSIRGTYGRVAEVPPALEGANITQDTARIAVSPLVDPGYIALFLRSPLAQHYFKSVARGVAVKGVNIADVRAMPVLLPPRNEQARIVTEVERRLAIVQRAQGEIDVQIARAVRLRQSILKCAFDGMLVPQELSDEPASVLLANIRAERDSTLARRSRRSTARSGA
jgi:type I restriction enzyme S subunit